MIGACIQTRYPAPSPHAYFCAPGLNRAEIPWILLPAHPDAPGDPSQPVVRRAQVVHNSPLDAAAPALPERKFCGVVSHLEAPKGHGSGGGTTPLAR